jgi:hypothetical protein
MKKLISIAGVAVVALSSSAFAQNVGSGQIRGVVQPVCGVTDMFASLAFPNMNANAVVEDNFRLKCNDGDGATLRVISTEGHLESDDLGRAGGIKHRVQVVGTTIPEFDSIVLEANGVNDQAAEGSSTDAAKLADGVSGKVRVTLLESGRWAGGYSDTIQLQLSAN